MVLYFGWFSRKISSGRFGDIFFMGAGSSMKNIGSACRSLATCCFTTFWNGAAMCCLGLPYLDQLTGRLGQLACDTCSFFMWSSWSVNRGSSRCWESINVHPEICFWVLMFTEGSYSTWLRETGFAKWIAGLRITASCGLAIGWEIHFQWNSWGLGIWSTKYQRNSADSSWTLFRCRGSTSDTILAQTNGFGHRLLATRPGGLGSRRFQTGRRWWVFVLVMRCN